MPLTFPPVNFDHVEFWADRQLRNRKRWDEEPEAGFLVADQRARNGLGHRKFPITQMIWHNAGKPYVVLENATRFSSMFNSFKRVAPTASVRALYLRNEGYAPPEDIEREFARRAVAGEQMPYLGSVAGAREIRMVTVYDFTGRRWMGQMMRGKEHEPLTILHDDLDGNPALSGNVVDAMQAFVDKFLLDT